MAHDTLDAWRTTAAFARAYPGVMDLQAMTPATTRPFLDGLTFGEGPRWHGGRLWFSDFFSHSVRSVPTSGEGQRREAEVNGQPSGLGWLPDGRLLIVSMRDRRIIRRETDGSLTTHADVSNVAPSNLNDMLVLDDGTAFAGHFGFDLDAFFDGNADPAPASLLKVAPDGTIEVAASDLSFPNGMVLLGSTLVVAETFGRTLTAFDVGPGGTLGGRRTWAPLETIFPDGICGDAEGAIWVANATAPECVRVAEGGEVLERVATSQPCFACVLGGEDRRSLYCCTAPTSRTDQLMGERLARIETTSVRVPGAGLP